MSDDDRVVCVSCAWYRGNRCMQARAARISHHASIEIGRDLANLPQRCPAWKAKQ